MCLQGLDVVESGAQSPAGLHLVDGPRKLGHRQRQRGETDRWFLKESIEARQEAHPELLVWREAELLQQG